MVSREELYKLVWSIPMVKVAAKFSVSGSYMARVCSALNVPRPDRGYWANLEVGKAPDRPVLPESSVGEPQFWSHGDGNLSSTDVGVAIVTYAPSNAGTKHLANELFNAFEASGHRVRFAASMSRLYRPHIDECKEVPKSKHGEHLHRNSNVLQAFVANMAETTQLGLTVAIRSASYITGEPTSSRAFHKAMTQRR